MRFSLILIFSLVLPDTVHASVATLRAEVGEAPTTSGVFAIVAATDEEQEDLDGEPGAGDLTVTGGCSAIGPHGLLWPLLSLPCLRRRRKAPS